jgi:IMP cyclohydrolase
MELSEGEIIKELDYIVLSTRWNNITEFIKTVKKRMSDKGYSCVVLSYEAPNYGNERKATIIVILDDETIRVNYVTKNELTVVRAEDQENNIVGIA